MKVYLVLIECEHDDVEWEDILGIYSRLDWAEARAARERRREPATAVIKVQAVTVDEEPTS